MIEPSSVLVLESNQMALPTDWALLSPLLMFSGKATRRYVALLVLGASALARLFYALLKFVGIKSYTVTLTSSFFTQGSGSYVITAAVLEWLGVSDPNEAPKAVGLTYLARPGCPSCPVIHHPHRRPSQLMCY
jgi:hypothetical protein